MKNRNVIVELARFVFSVLVVGYHVQMSMNNNAADFFENGALAVEFFFLISGYFLARSIEKVNANYMRKNFGIETLRFMKNKVKGILPTHLTAIVAMVIVLLVFDLSNAGAIIVRGLPSVFLVHMAEVWDGSYNLALIVPEWYLSAMLVCMLFMFPIGLLLRKKLRGEFVPLILTGILVVVMLAVGLPLNFPQNLIYDVRAWGEMCVGMFAYYLSRTLAVREFNKPSAVTLKVIEVCGYGLPVILGFIPVSEALQPMCMAVTVVGVFAAISITFANKGVSITNEKVGKVFAFLGSISLAVYLFHPVIISLLDYAYVGCAQWIKMLIVLPSAIIAAVVFRLVCFGISKLCARVKGASAQQ
ncbi:MAG: acyltransferase [Clostridia bacterium]|nr:acyltransferase [Clostridia bacterium]